MSNTQPSQSFKIEAEKRQIAASYVLPIASHISQAPVLSGYLQWLSRVVDDVIVVDGSGKAVFDAHAKVWGAHVRHIPPTFLTTNGKVAGVITGVTAARYEAVIVADDDIRYRKDEILRIIALLREYDVVRPQNMFKPLPWHARWDTARSLINRLSGGDWPGTLGIRKSILQKAGGYRGDVLFENLEMVRTVQAAGGREVVALDLIIARRPPTALHFLSQRTRQAYDEWARPLRFASQLALLPAAIWITREKGILALVALAALSIAAAEGGRRKGGGRKFFPWTSAIWAPAWFAERALTSWVALFTRLLLGGVRYRTTRLKRAATPLAKLRKLDIKAD